MYQSRIKEVAEKKGHTIATLARSGNIPYSTVWDIWHASNKTSKLRTLIKVSLALDVRIADLYERIPEKQAGD